MKVTIEFETGEIFNSNCLGAVEQYLRGNLRAVEAANALGWSKQDWEGHLAAIFSVALKPFKPGVASITVDGHVVTRSQAISPNQKG